MNEEENIPICILILCFIAMLFFIAVGQSTPIYYYAYEISDEPVEYLYVFNQAGYVQFGIKGEENRVLVPSHLIYILPDKITVHNHPNGICEFSEDDLRFFKETKSSEMWVVTNESILIQKRNGMVIKINWSETDYGRQNKRIQNPDAC